MSFRRAMIDQEGEVDEDALEKLHQQGVQAEEKLNAAWGGICLPTLSSVGLKIRLNKDSTPLERQTVFDVTSAAVARATFKQEKPFGTVETSSDDPNLIVATGFHKEVVGNQVQVVRKLVGFVCATQNIGINMERFINPDFSEKGGHKITGTICVPAMNMRYVAAAVLDDSRHPFGSYNPGVIMEGIRRLLEDCMATALLEVLTKKDFKRLPCADAHDIRLGYLPKVIMDSALRIISEKPKGKIIRNRVAKQSHDEFFVRCNDAGELVKSGKHSVNPAAVESIEQVAPFPGCAVKVGLRKLS